MNNYLTLDSWLIIEEGFNPANNKKSESLFSIGNGHIGQRANFEESYSGETLPGNYLAGIYYPDPTKVGYWKVGYPEYFAKIVNVTNWIGIEVSIAGEQLDLAKHKVIAFKRILNMREGYLERNFIVELNNAKKVKIHAQRFLSIVATEIGAIKYSITPLNFSGELQLKVYLDADVINEDSNYREKFLNVIDKEIYNYEGYINTVTRKTDFHICTSMKFDIVVDGNKTEINSEIITKEKYIANLISLNCEQNKTITVYKYAANISSLNHPKEKLSIICKQVLGKAYSQGFNLMLQEQAEAWIKKWEHSDVIIEGDIAAQQAIRFNIFQLNQTYTGENPSLNIGPKGFTGEKYGGGTYWDTEAYHFPFYLCTAGQKIAKNLLLYRYRHLDKAIVNATKLGFKNGAALYPMVTINGEECHNEWEITFEEIHRNGAIAYAIFNYVRYTGDQEYLFAYGLEILIAIARFWSQRVNFSKLKSKYVMLGVTGPNEYENNIDNNWYTNTMACWTMNYTIEVISLIKKHQYEKYLELASKITFDEFNEISKWKEIINKMYFPTDEKLGIFLQQENYLEKEQMLAKDLKPEERPINQHWSWDRILRSCFIKQADVLQGLYFLEDNYDEKTIKRNFDFYEPRTVHESSLSPCVHSIIAAKLGYQEKAYELYLRTARLDLDDYNNEVKEGCHLPSMSGSWLAIVQGFGGMRVKNNELHFNPFIVTQWKMYSFKIIFRDNLLRVTVKKNEIELANESVKAIDIWVGDKKYRVEANSIHKIEEACYTASQN